jgi:uncharacterized protein (TIGR02145 family)
VRTQNINKGQANPAPTYGRGWLTLFTAALALAITFTISCTSNVEMPPPPENFVEAGGSSSSGSKANSSGSENSSSSATPGSSSSAVIGVGSCEDFVKGAKREHYGMDKEQFCDERDGKKYVYVKIGEQTWMAENLNYNASGSKCGNGSTLSDANTTTCDTYGRLYDWSTAMAVCPFGWHLPSNAEWDALMTAVGGSSTAGKYLKATSGWNSNGNGLDSYGFSALPGGYGSSGGNFSSVGDLGYWWSASEGNSSRAYFRWMLYNSEGAIDNFNDKGNLFSVRCVED